MQPIHLIKFKENAIGWNEMKLVSIVPGETKDIYVFIVKTHGGQWMVERYWGKDVEDIFDSYKLKEEYEL